MSTKKSPNEIHITRLYDAPVTAVWEAWTDPAQVAQWWGPRGFTLTTHSKDLRSGGHWRYTMHGPDGIDYPNHTIYFEVEKNVRLVYDHGGNDEQPPMFRVRVLFSESAGQTKMEMCMTFPSPEIAAESKKFIKKAGGEGTWDRLAEFLCKAASGKEQFVINRSFEVPMGLMYEMWTKIEHFAKWMGPTGSTLEVIRADVRVGGSAIYCMDTAGGLKMYGRIHYLEMHKPKRLVYAQEFVDKDEVIARHPLAPIWPETMLTTVMLSEEESNKTRVTLIWEAYGKVVSEDLQAFVAARAGMTGGWTGSFDKLEEYGLSLSIR